MARPHLALYAAAGLTKEHTAILPLLLLWTDYFWNPGFSFEGIRRNWRLYAPLAAGAVIGAIGVFRILGGADSAGFAISGKHPDFPGYLRERFAGRESIPVDPVEFLNEEGAELILTGVMRDPTEELGLEVNSQNGSKTGH